MPLPLIVPIAIGGVALATGGGLTVNARRTIKKAIDNYEAAYRRVCAQARAIQVTIMTVRNSVCRNWARSGFPAWRRVRAAIDFIRRAKLANPEIIGDEEVKAEDLESLDQAYGDILKTSGWRGSQRRRRCWCRRSNCFGSLRLGGCFGNGIDRSRNRGIERCSPPAAPRWRGSAVVQSRQAGWASQEAPRCLGGIVAAPIPVAIGAFQQVKARRIQRESESRVRDLKLKEAEIRRDHAKLKAVRQRCYEVQRTILELIEQLQDRSSKR